MVRKHRTTAEEAEAEDGEITVKVDRGIYTRLKTLLSKNTNKKYRVDTKHAVNKITKEFVEKQELFERYSPFLEIINVMGNSMYIKDEKKNMLAEVRLNYTDTITDNILLECQLCKTDYCVHTAFCLGSEKLGELNTRVRNHS